MALTPMQFEMLMLLIDRLIMLSKTIKDISELTPEEARERIRQNRVEINDVFDRIEAM